MLTFSIRIKGSRNPQDPKMVKLKMVFWQHGYTRVTKLLNVTGPFEEWDNKTQAFNSSKAEALAKNRILLNLRNQYQTVAEEWEAEERKWTPVELSHYFDKKKTTKAKVKAMSVIQTIDHLRDHFYAKKKNKNGRIVTSVSNAKKYEHFKTALSEFTRDHYGKSLASYHFQDIDEQFLLDFVLFTEQKGIAEGNRGNLTTKLRTLRAICQFAVNNNFHGASMEIFGCVGDKIKWPETTSKAVPYYVIKLIEGIDRSMFDEDEQLCLDMFMFSFHACGMGNVDVMYLTKDLVDFENRTIIYERMKFPKTAKPVLTDPAIRLLMKYWDRGYENHVFPIFKAKHSTDMKRMRRVNTFTGKVNRTLEKACRILQIKERVTWYSARGSFITKMIDEGYRSHAIAKLAGNSALTIEKHYYKNVQKESMIATMNGF